MDPYRYKSPRGYPIDTNRCAASVATSGAWGQHHQCCNSRQPGIEWCGTHDPNRVAAREQLRQDKRVARATAIYNRSPLRKVEAMQKELAALSVAYEARGIAHGMALCDKITARADLARHRVAVEGLQIDKARLEAEVERLRAWVVVAEHVASAPDMAAQLEAQRAELDDHTDTISDVEDALPEGYKVDEEHSLLECIQSMASVFNLNEGVRNLQAKLAAAAADAFDKGVECEELETERDAARADAARYENLLGASETKLDEPCPNDEDHCMCAGHLGLRLGNAEQRADALAALVGEVIDRGQMGLHWRDRALELLEPQAGEERDA